MLVTIVVQLFHCIYKYWLGELPTIHQKFPPLKFSHVWYLLSTLNDILTLDFLDY